jgi:hypothetical protein
MRTLIAAYRVDHRPTDRLALHIWVTPGRDHRGLALADMKYVAIRDYMRQLWRNAYGWVRYETKEDEEVVTIIHYDIHGQHPRSHVLGCPPHSWYNWAGCWLSGGQGLTGVWTQAVMLLALGPFQTG